jgi:hypothetical protein
VQTHHLLLIKKSLAPLQKHWKKKAPTPLLFSIVACWQARNFWSYKAANSFPHPRLNFFPIGALASTRSGAAPHGCGHPGPDLCTRSCSTGSIQEKKTAQDRIHVPACEILPPVPMASLATGGSYLMEARAAHSSLPHSLVPPSFPCG